MKILSMTGKTALVWFAINTVIGTVIALFVHSGEGGPFIQTIAVSQIITHTVSFPTVAVGRIVFPPGGIFMDIRLSAAITLAVTAAASLAGIFFAGFVPGTHRFSLSSPWLILVPSLIISAGLTAAPVVFEKMKEGKNELEKGLSELRTSAAAEGLSVRTDGEIRFVKFHDIVYLSSSGRTTVIHTRMKDYEVFQLLGDFEEKLPPAFIRVHKQFIVNTSRISRLKYYEGGRYNLYLDDEDESIIPVGRSCLSALKQRLNA